MFTECLLGKESIDYKDPVIQEKADELKECRNILEVSADFIF